MKNKTTNIEYYIAKRDYSENKKRNILSVISIILTTFLITVVFSLGKAYWDGITKRSVMMEGAIYDVQLPEPTEDQIVAAQKSDLVKNAGAVLKCAVINKYQDQSCDEIRMYWCDSTAWYQQYVPAFESVTGTYPKNRNEIMISEYTLKKLGINNPYVGMTITDLEVTNLSEKGGTEKRTFVLSGIFKDYSREAKIFVSKAFSEETGAKLTDLTQGTLNITLKNHIYSEQDIKSLEKDIRLDENQIIYADLNLKEDFMKMAFALIVLISIIGSSGYLFIYNVQYITTTRKIQFWGQLKTIGFTDTQVGKMQDWQTLVNLFLGLTIGILTGCLIAFGFTPIVLNILGATTLGEQHLFYPEVIVSAIIFSTIVVWTSNIKIKNIVKKISPIAALKFNSMEGSKRKEGKIGSGKITAFARKNIFRDRKQAIIIFASLSFALATFITVNVVIESNAAKNILNKVFTYDYRILNQTIPTDNISKEISEDYVNDIKNINGIKEVWPVYSTKIAIPYEKDLFEQYYKDVYASPVATGDYESDMKEYQINPENNLFLGNLVGIGESEFEAINLKLGNTIDKEKFMDGKIALIKGTIGISPKETLGKDVDFWIPGQKEKYSIQIVEDYTEYRGPNYFAAGVAPDIIVSDKFIKKISDAPIELLDIIYDTPFNISLDTKLSQMTNNNPNTTTDSKMADYDELKQTENQLKILGYILCGVLALIAIVNYGNMIASGIESRKVELAILRSIGMTPAQVRKMLMLEGVGYGIISIVVSLILGIPLSYGMFSAMNKYGVEYKIPFISNFIIIIAVLVVCVLLPNIFYRITPSKSIIDVLKENN